MTIRKYTNWNKRAADSNSQREPYKKFFFICEGAMTEQAYFKRLIDNKKKLGIKPIVDLILLEKDGDENGLSFPKNLIDKANKIKSDSGYNFDKKHDEMVIIFDADIFEYRSRRYNEIIDEGKKSNNILGVTNPCFEFFLLLHFKGAFESDIKGLEKEFLKEENLGKKGYAYRKLQEKTKINSKSNPKIGELADDILIAIEQEKKINQDINNCKGNVTSNIGRILEDIINYKS